MMVDTIFRTGRWDDYRWKDRNSPVSAGHFADAAVRRRAVSPELAPYPDQPCLPPAPKWGDGQAGSLSITLGFSLPGKFVISQGGFLRQGPLVGKYFPVRGGLFLASMQQNGYSPGPVKGKRSGGDGGRAGTAGPCPSPLGSLFQAGELF